MKGTLLAYTLYGTLALLLIGWLGRNLHRRGRVFILGLFRGDARPADAMNNLLLAAYYLFNAGYAFVRIWHWAPVQGLAGLSATLGRQLGVLMLILAIAHYVNMGLIFWLARKRHLPLPAPDTTPQNISS